MNECSSAGLEWPPRKIFMSKNRSLLLPIVLALLLLAPQDVKPLIRAPVRLVENGTVVELDLDGAMLADVLDAAQPVLGVPLHADPADLANTTLSERGTRRIPRDKFRDAFDDVLRRYDFWTWDDDSGGDTTLLVFKKDNVDRVGLRAQPFTPPVVTLEELAAGPRKRSPLYTATFQLTHVNARNVLVTAMGLFDSRAERIAHVEGSNQLIATASREHLLALRDQLKLVDVPGATPTAWEAELGAIGDRLDAIEQRLAALEKKAGG
jgi:hypothetical protein